MTPRQDSAADWARDLDDAPTTTSEGRIAAGDGDWWGDGERSEPVAHRPGQGIPRGAIALWAGFGVIAVASIFVTVVGGLPRLLVFLGLIACVTALASMLRRKPMWLGLRTFRVRLIVLLAGSIAIAVGAALLTVTASQPDPAPPAEPIVEPAPSEAAIDAPPDAPTPPSSAAPTPTPAEPVRAAALDVLETLPVKGRAPRTGYDREGMFGQAWFDADANGCDTRNDILARDLLDASYRDECIVESGVLTDPFTGQVLTFQRGWDTSVAVQIDHVVALSNAWQTGAQQLTQEQRVSLANDPLNLLAVDGPSNQQKSDSDAATWLPSNKAFRCSYVARQIAVKAKYALWVVPPERDAMQSILSGCPGESLPIR